jgi:predicted phage terminase large subunit-like protein
VQDRVYIEDCRGGQLSPNGAEDLIVAAACDDGPACEQDIPQDPGQAGLAQKAHLAKRLHGHRVTFSPETGSKESRARPLAAQAEAGNVYLVRGPWNAAFIAEACLFPHGRYKDRVDAASRAYSNLVRRRRAGVSTYGPKVIG